jgi:hypothetical protein
MREKRNACKVLVGKPEGKNDLNDLEVDGNVILKLFLKKEYGRTSIGVM